MATSTLEAPFEQLPNCQVETTKDNNNDTKSPTTSTLEGEDADNSTSHNPQGNTSDLSVTPTAENEDETTPKVRQEYGEDEHSTEIHTLLVPLLGVAEENQEQLPSMQTNAPATMAQVRKPGVSFAQEVELFEFPVSVESIPADVESADASNRSVNKCRALCNKRNLCRLLAAICFAGSIGIFLHFDEVVVKERAGSTNQFTGAIVLMLPAFGMLIFAMYRVVYVELFPYCRRRQLRNRRASDDVTDMTVFMSLE